MNRLGLTRPIVAAPMAGGASTPALVRAAAEAGGLGFVPGGYRSPADLREEIRALRAADVPFGVNLFRVTPTPVEAADYDAYARELADEAAVHDVELPTGPPRNDDTDAWAEKLTDLLADPVAWLTTTFGMPTAEELSALHAVGTRVGVTVTSVAEARAAGALGVDLLVVQGAAAGGHSGIHDPAGTISQLHTAELVGQIAAMTRMPIIAGGGVDGPAAVARLIDAGADAVAVGTLLLRSDESGASATHRAALTDPRYTETVITRAFTGRPARGLRNGFIDRHEASVPPGYPAIHHLTAPLRRAAGAAGDPERLHLWAGTGFAAAGTGPAAAILSSLVPGV